MNLTRIHIVGAFIFCSVALLFAGAQSASAEIHEIGQVGITFVPDQITVQPGDTIRWNWSGGNHTVTSGSGCVFDGIHFNEPLTTTNATVEYTVPMEFTGEIPYFCQPHCVVNMVGNITVEGAPPCPPDINGDAVVDVLDLLALLAAWGNPGGPADINGDGIVDVLDLLEVLAAWGPC